jgi:hypothetical protein
VRSVRIEAVQRLPFGRKQRADREHIAARRGAESAKIAGTRKPRTLMSMDCGTTISAVYLG